MSASHPAARTLTFAEEHVREAPCGDGLQASIAGHPAQQLAASVLQERLNLRLSEVDRPRAHVAFLIAWDEKKETSVAQAIFLTVECCGQGEALRAGFVGCLRLDCALALPARRGRRAATGVRRGASQPSGKPSARGRQTLQAGPPACSRSFAAAGSRRRRVACRRAGLGLDVLSTAVPGRWQACHRRAARRLSLRGEQKQGLKISCCCSWARRGLPMLAASSWCWLPVLAAPTAPGWASSPAAAAAAAAASAAAPAAAPAGPLLEAPRSAASSRRCFLLSVGAACPGRGALARGGLAAA